MTVQCIPENITVGSMHDGEATVDWECPTHNEEVTHFLIKLWTNESGSGYGRPALIEKTVHSVDDYHYTFSGLSDKFAYLVSVTAFNGTDEGVESEQVSFRG